MMITKQLEDVHKQIILGPKKAHDLGKLVCFSQKLIENKEHKSLHKMHFKPQGSSAVEELHKLTD